MSSIDISRTSPPSGVHTVIAHSQSQPCIIKVKSRQSLKPSYCRLELPGATGDHIRKQSGVQISSHRPAAATTIIPCRRSSHWLRTDPRLLAATNYTLLNAAHKSRETQLPTIPPGIIHIHRDPHNDENLISARPQKSFTRSTQKQSHSPVRSTEGGQEEPAIAGEPNPLDLSWDIIRGSPFQQ